MDQLDTANLEQLSPEMAAMLPDEVRQMIEIHREAKLQKIAAIGEAIAKKRDEAIAARASSGIEQQWDEDEEAYQGIDDANRDEAGSYKPSSPNGSFVQKRSGKGVRSNVFLNITRPYVDAAAARVADMVMPTDDRNWAIKPTPIPELRKRLAKTTQPGPAFEQMIAQIVERATKQAEVDQRQIDDWLNQSLWHAEFRKVLEDSARLGVGIMKGPTPVKRKTVTYQNGNPVMSISIDPESRRIDPRNFFPDGACGDNIHNGSHVFERDELSTRKLRDLKGTPGYLAEMIDKVIEEGPGMRHVGQLQVGGKGSTGDDEKFEIWYYYGLLDKDDLEALELDPADIPSVTGVPTIVTMVNDTAIKAALNPLDTGEFPYDVLPWQRRPDTWTGTGVGRQVRTPQRIINAATRNMMDNAGISGGGVYVVRKGAVEPADGTWEITPRKILYVKEDADIKSVEDAVAVIQLPSNQQEMLAIVQFALKLAEDVTGLPMILQGQQGQAPDTVGGMQIINNNAGTVLRRIARTIDDCLTDPHIRRYYDWLQAYGDDPGERDNVIDARGSSALVERDLQNQAIIQMGQLVLNPAFELDPALWMEESLKAQRLDPKRFKLSDEKKKQLAQQQPAPPPQVMAAQIRAATTEKVAAIEAQVDQLRIKSDTDRDTVYVQAERERTQVETAARQRELEAKLQLAQLDYASKHNLKLEDVKAKLADTAMRLNVQKELAAVTLTTDLHKHHNPQVTAPATEPPGRAPAGQAFQQ